jgi:hypothetical protein
LKQKTSGLYYTAILGNHILSVGLATVSMIFLLGMAGCGGRPATIPTAFVQGFLSKQATMVDVSLVDFYVEEEQQQIEKKVDEFISVSRTNGTFDNLKHATFDFKGIDIKIIDEKEEYVNDVPTTFLKIGTKGSFTMTLKNGSKTIPTDSIFILEKVGADWRVTETLNPWG